MSESVESVQTVIEDLDTSTIDTQDAASVSFDELDFLTDGRNEEKLLNEAAKNIEAKSTPEDQQYIEEESSGEKRETKQEEIEEEIKKILAKQGEADVELFANAKFKHKVDGEEVEVELQELLNNYSGKVSYDRKFQELSESNKIFKQERDTYLNEKQEIKNYINTFTQKLQNNDAMGALEYIAGFSGMEPLAFRRELLNQLTPIIMDRANMTQEQLEADDLMMQNAYLRQQYESVQERQRQEQAIKELESQIASVQEAHGMTEDTFRDAYNNLVESGYSGEITPSKVAEFYTEYNAYSKASDLLSEVDPALGLERNVVENLQRVIVENPSFDDNDLIEIVQEVYGSVKKEISQKVSKKASVPMKQSTSKTVAKQNYVDFDDL